MGSSTGRNAAMLRILYGTAVTALEKLRLDETVSETFIADLEAVAEGSLGQLERIAEVQSANASADGKP